MVLGFNTSIKTQSSLDNELIKFASDTKLEASDTVLDCGLAMQCCPGEPCTL